MDHLSLTPATQAILDALTDLGQGTVHELADKAGKARSTTDKAIKTLADAGLIVPVDTDADLADGTPTRWTLATPDEATDDAPDDTAVAADQHAAGTDEVGLVDLSPALPTDEPNTGDTEPTDQLGETADGDRSDDAQDATDRDNKAGAAQDETGKAQDDGDKGTGEDRAQDEALPVAVVQPARPGDRKVMAIKGVLADYGDDGATLDVIVAESGIGHPTASRLLTAMEQADAARRLPGLPQRWIPGPTKASEVDPNPEPPRCPLCHHVIRGLAAAPSAAASVQPLIRPDGTLHVVGPAGQTHVITLPTRMPPRATGTARSGSRRNDGTVNTDGSQPFGRGELEKLTLDVLTANPGRAMTPQDIATAIGTQLGRTVSSGAVRNNCTKAAAAGHILLVSDNPLTFTRPAPVDNTATADADPGSTDQS